MSPHTSLLNEREPLLAPLTEPTEVQDALITGSQVYQAVGSNRDGEGGEEHIGDEDEEDDDTPLPLGQILGLCYVRLVEPVAFFSVFAFLNQMLWEIGDIGEGEVGFYSGLIVSSFRWLCFWGEGKRAGLERRAEERREYMLTTIIE